MGAPHSPTTEPIDRRQRMLDVVFDGQATHAHTVFAAAARDTANPFLLSVAYQMAHLDAGPGPAPEAYSDGPDGDAAYAQDAERFLDAVDATTADFLDIARRVMHAAADLTSPTP